MPRAPLGAGAPNTGPRHEATAPGTRRPGQPEAAPGPRRRAQLIAADAASRPDAAPPEPRGPARGLAVTFGGKLLELVVLFQETQVDRLLLLGHRAPPSPTTRRAAANLEASALVSRRYRQRRRNHRDEPGRVTGQREECWDIPGPPSASCGCSRSPGLLRTVGCFVL